MADNQTYQYRTQLTLKRAWGYAATLNQNLPNVLSESEVIRILNAPKNIKHKAILYTLCSAGLRVKEIIDL